MGKVVNEGQCDSSQNDNQPEIRNFQHHLLNKNKKSYPKNEVASQRLFNNDKN